MGSVEQHMPSPCVFRWTRSWIQLRVVKVLKLESGIWTLVNMRFTENTQQYLPEQLALVVVECASERGFLGGNVWTFYNLFRMCWTVSCDDRQPVSANVSRPLRVVQRKLYCFTHDTVCMHYIYPTNVIAEYWLLYGWFREDPFRVCCSNLFPLCVLTSWIHRSLNESPSNNAFITTSVFQHKLTI